MKSNRQQDSQGEKVISQFLDTHFYDTLRSNTIRNRNVSMQKAGVDIVIEMEDDTWYCDEKCALDYINKELKTFSFELRASSDYNGMRYEGWLTSPRNITTHYNLIYITKCKVDRRPTIDDIQSVEIIIVAKRDILNYFKKLGWNRSSLLKKCDTIDSGKDTYMGNVYKDGMKFVKSQHKVESPINVLIPKEELIKMSTAHRVIKVG